jgi:hypothetical protein
MGLSAEANIDLTSLNATLTSVTSWRNWSSDLGQDIDYTGADIAHRLQDGEYGFSVESVTQELRLAGATDRVDWLVGLFATAAASEMGCEVYVSPLSKACSSNAAAISGFIATAPNGA